MTLKRFSHLLLSLALAIATALAPFGKSVLAQSPASGAAAPAPAAAPQDLSAQLAAIEKAIEEKRKEYHVPGVSLVIVKDDKVIYVKGLGLKDVGRNLPVTPDTLFAIGSSTKAFTGMAAVMSADDGKLSLDDSPRRFLPYFKLRDPEADAKITLRDLLSHRSGLDRTDLFMFSGTLNREELIRVVGMAKPTAKLGEKFLYQNVMFAAAGEIVAKAQGTTWDKFITERIFKPLGMKASNTTVAATLKAPDYSLGYNYNTETKETQHVPMREIAPTAPAGAINSSARDMAQWVRLMLNEGVFEGKRLVSEKSFREMVSPQNKVAGTVNYGLGWFLRNWNGHKVVEHSGDIGGFNAQVALMPDQKLGLVLLTNISGSPLGAYAMNAVWSNIVGKPQTGADAASTAIAAADPSREVGKYLLAAANLTFNVEVKDGKLRVSVPGQPEYDLENVGGRRYKLANAPAGFFITFRPVKDNDAETEAYLEQPQGNYVLSRIKESADARTADPAAPYNGSLKEVLGSYEMKGGPTAEVAVREGKVVLVVAGQPPYPLAEREKDKLYSPALPDSYSFSVKRDASGKVSGLVMKESEDEFELARISAEETAPPPITVDELVAKMVAAQGGEENLRRHKSSVTTSDVVLEHQGLTGTNVITARAPDLVNSATKIMAFGKQVATIDVYFDGVSGVEISSFAPPEVKTGKSLEELRVQANYYGVLDWKKLFKSVVVKKMSKVGDEDVYVVVKTPEKGAPVTDYISAKSFLLLRRDTISSSNTSEIMLPVTEFYSDFRALDGMMVPFKTVTNIPTIGDIVTTVKAIKFDVNIPDSAFRAPAKAMSSKQ